MIELRALAYFATACRSESLAGAAADLGIAPSTLSTTLKSLGKTLGLSLFRRIGTGLYPTAEARWLMRLAEPLLAGEAFARRWTAASCTTPAQLLVIDIGLSFTLGGIGAAVERAVAAMEAEMPCVLVDRMWRGEPDPRPISDLIPSWSQGAPHRLFLGLADDDAIAGGRTATVLRDRWVFALRLPADTDSPATAAEIAAGRIVVPALARPLLDQAKSYVARRGMSGVRFVDEDPGDLPRLIDEFSDAALFVPQSMVAPRLGLLRVMTVASDPPLVTRIVSHSPRADAVTLLFVRLLKRALAEPWRPSPRDPKVSLRQIHYFALARRLRRVSAAAQGANVSQPALSEQLRKLERTLGADLFERRGDGLKPSAKGDRFAWAAKLVDARHRDIAAGSSPTPPAGRIAFGILPSVSQHGLLVNRITEAVLSVQSRHPSLKLVIVEAPHGTLLEWVARGIVGAAIVETGLAHMPRLPLGSSEELAAVAHARHALLPAGSVTFADLLQLPLALPTARFGLRRLIEAAAKERGLQIRPFIEVDALSMVVAILARLPVCTVLPASSIRRELAAGELVAHPIVDPVIARRLYVIYSGERSLSEAERDLVNALRARLTDTSVPEIG